MNTDKLLAQVIQSLVPFRKKLLYWDYEQTNVDQWTHDYLISALSPFGFPIFSEEGDDIDRAHLETFWVIDPLDGTKDFYQQTGYYSTLIGLIHRGQVVLGINLVPTWDKLYYAQKDKGAFLVEGSKAAKPIRVSTQADISQAELLASRNHFSPPLQDFTDLHKLKLQKLGSNGCKIGLISEGQGELFFNPTDKMGLWDVCGLDILIREAGGTMTDCKGERIDYRQASKHLPFGIAVSNTILHQVLINFTSKLHA